MPQSAKSAKFAPVTEAEIQQMTDPGSFSRGKSYFRNGHIQETEIRGNTLLAECVGSYAVPYRVEATLRLSGSKGENPVEYDCSCPVDGCCKHIVAMLLTWIAKPETFRERQPIAALLAERSRDELIALIERMVDRNPALQSMVELPVAKPSESAARTAEVRDVTIQRQIDAVFGKYDDRAWGAAGVIAGALEEILHEGDAYAKAGRWADAQVVYTVLAESLVNWLGDGGNDHDGDIGAVIAGCDEGLASCLEAQPTLPESQRLPQVAREDLIRAVYDIWQFDIFELGGTGIAGAGLDAVAELGTPAERQLVESWLDKEKPGRWSMDIVAEVRIMMRETGEQELSDEELLDVYLRDEHWKAVVFVQVNLGQMEAAFATVAAHKFEPREVIEIADHIIENHPELTERVVEMVDARYWPAPNKRDFQINTMYDWLIQRQTALGKQHIVIEMAEKRFLQNANLVSYREIEQTAVSLDATGDIWREQREHLLDLLMKKEQWAVLAEIHLQDKEIRAALDAYSGYRVAAGSMRRGDRSVAVITVDWVMQLAQAAEKDFPEEAAGIYGEQAEQKIGARQRGAYRLAGELLLKAKAVLEAHDLEAMWRQMIGGIRARHANLRAMQEELDKLDVN